MIQASRSPRKPCAPSKRVPRFSRNTPEDPRPRSSTRTRPSLCSGTLRALRMVHFMIPIPGYSYWLRPWGASEGIAPSKAEKVSGAVAGSKEQGAGSGSTTPAAAISITKTPGRPWTADWPGEVIVNLEDVGGDGRYWRPDGTPMEGSRGDEYVGVGMVAKTGKDEISRHVSCASLQSQGRALRTLL